MSREHSRPLGLRDVHDRVSVARNDLASACALIGDNVLGAPRVLAAMDVLNDLLRDLEYEGLPA